MNNNESVKYYCFNKYCKSSIYSDSCSVVEVSVERAFSEVFHCKNCAEELVCHAILELQTELNTILNEDRRLPPALIDDDIVYHSIFMKLLKHSDSSKNIVHFKDGMSALDEIFNNESDNIPNLIFLDINTREMDAWKFLDQFEKHFPQFVKKVRIYLVTDEILPNHRQKIKRYKTVKALINKPYNKHMLNVCFNV